MIQVAAYCRVSTDKEDQANSFASQQSYFKEYISKNPDWNLYEIYADEGISGTSTRKRRQFNRMIRDAHEGRFQLILTKEVSRFSRNIVDTLSYTRELKRIGVAVEFVTDNINTMDGDGELRLSIMAIPTFVVIFFGFRCRTDRGLPAVRTGLLRCSVEYIVAIITSI